ncbi:MAG: hypothetical protein A3F16_00955 [Deltaproteobacteria bacterium RIFCSPHIGHO2_12_FULL_43_9]|nr:MAG: hypothetical protein A3F16_00955 [Deltaproteobacteria bacterium RIFCSPHIGHO2_12_FULL_43_9]
MKEKGLLRYFVHFFTNLFSVKIWESDLETLPIGKRLIIYLARLFYLVTRGFVKNKNLIRATALAYTTLLSLVPLFAVMFSLFKVFGGFERFGEKIHPFLYRFFNIAEGSPIYQKLWEYVDKVHAGAIGIVGSLVLIIAAISLFITMERSFNEIWGVQKGRPWTKKFTNYWTLITIGPLFFALSVWIQAPVLILIVFITFLYIYVPYTSVKFKSALIGGTVAGLLLEGARALYALYTVNYVGYEKIYGAVAAIPLFLIWIEIGWFIVLIGTEIAFADQNMKRYRDEQMIAGVNIEQREIAALQITLRIAEKYLYDEKAITATEISESLNIPLRLVRELLYHLNLAHVVAEVGEMPHRYLPSRPLTKITLKDVINAYKGVGTKRLRLTDTKIGKYLQQALDEADSTVEKNLGRTLAEIVDTLKSKE